MKYWIVLLLLAGCAGEQTEDLGGGKYTVSACSDAGLTNPQVGAVRAADRYCGKFGEAAVVERFDEQSCGKPATAATAVVFSCR